MSCIIQLHNYQGQYHAGDDIIGKVICSFPKRENIRGIVLILKGKEKNKWTEGSGDDTQTFKSKNKFLRVVNTLQNGGDIGPGELQYPFTFQLPRNIPSTYKGRYGGIFFSLKVKVDRPFAIDYTNQKEIIVLSPINFNLIRNELQLRPVDYSIDEILCSLCCANGTITMDVHLEKKAFVVGEIANVRVHINNMSNTDVGGVSAELGMHVKSMASKRSKIKYEVIATNRAGGVVAQQQKTYNFPLKILAWIPNFNICKLFSRKTVLKVTAVIEGCHTNMVMELDITLGHIPVDGPSYVPVPPPYLPTAMMPY